MKICVVGAGAIGGLLGAKFALAGNEVSVIDRGAHLAAIQKNGLKLIELDGGEQAVRSVEARDSLDGLARQDLIVLAVKAHFLDSIARQIPALADPQTTIMTVQNGIPWWYFHHHGGPHDGRRLHSVDPTGVLEKRIDSGLIVGCTFRHEDRRGANGVQAKGGSRDITIRRCRFEHAGSRAINIGGSTGRAYFRPRPDAYTPASSGAADTARAELDALFGVETPSPQGPDAGAAKDRKRREAEEAKRRLDEMFGLDEGDEG